MMTTENSDLYEVTCADCGTTKSYFTAQGVSYFKLNHEGHNITVKEPTAADEPVREEPMAPPKVVETVEEPEVPFEMTVEAPLPEPEEPEEVEYAAPVSQVLAEDRIRLGNLVVDVVDEGTGRLVKVFGIANGREKFTKAFEVYKINELNGFLESGVFYDDAAKLTYTWTPDKVDLSMDVVKMIDEPPVAPESTMPEEVMVEKVGVPEPEVPAATAPPQVVPAAPVLQTPMPEGVLLGKRSYVEEGESFRQECARVSKVIRKFRWNTEPPYVIGAMFDDLMCVQSQTGMIKSALIEEVKKLGYTFVAIEAPAGIVSAWFKRNGSGGQNDEEVAEFHN